MKKTGSFAKDIIAPFAVLVCICLVVSFLLGVTNRLTAPVVEENARIAAEATRAAVLPGASGFTEVEADPSLGVDSIYKDDGGAGYVITASRAGYGGNVAVTVGIGSDGKIIGMQVNVSTETVGVGSKAGAEQYVSQFTGLSGSTDGVDTISGATYSSRAVKSAADAALAAFEAVK